MDSGTNDERYHDDSVVIKTDLDFSPLYDIYVSEAAKDGEVLTFTIHVTKNHDGTESSCVRNFLDFEYIHHCISTHLDEDGLIIPPLPVRPEVDAKSCENKSKLRYGDDTKRVARDSFISERRSIERYLNQLISHRIYGMHPSLITFLTGQLAPVHVHYNKGWLSKMVSKIDESLKSNYVDIDDYFQALWPKVINYQALLLQTSDDIAKMINSQIRLSCRYSEIESVLLMDETLKTLCDHQISQIFVKFVEGLEDTKINLESSALFKESTIAFELDMYSRYFSNFKTMLYKRVCIMSDYVNAEKSFENAKVDKKEEVKQVRNKAEATYEKCNSLAKDEIRRFNEDRCQAIKAALVKMAEYQLKLSRDTYALLMKTCNEIRLVTL